jgi:hypothetical protein
MEGALDGLLLGFLEGAFDGFLEGAFTGLDDTGFGIGIVGFGLGALTGLGLAGFGMGAATGFGAGFSTGFGAGLIGFGIGGTGGSGRPLMVNVMVEPGALMESIEIPVLTILPPW